MTNTTEMGQVLWRPPGARVANSNFAAFARWLEERGRLPEGASYDEVLAWSISDVDGFWSAIDEYFGTGLSGQASAVLSGPIDQARWFDGAQTNFAEELLRRAIDREEAVISVDERGDRRSVSGAQLHRAVLQLASEMRAFGVVPGDVVAGYLPNAVEAVIAFLASAYIGAVWTSCPPEFGATSVLDRFGQVRPKILFAVTGYTYRGQHRDRHGVVRDLIEGLGSLVAVMLVGDGDDGETGINHENVRRWSPATGLAGPEEEVAAKVPFSHPLWVLYSSGTTGLPKAIVHSHGGTLLEQLKTHVLHFDLRRSDRFFWFSTTGWVMWNITISALLAGSGIVTYDGDPFFPAEDRMWELAESEAITFMGLSAGHYQEYARRELCPGDRYDFEALQSLGSTGSPLSPEASAWIYDAVASDVAVLSISGGTDVATAFVGGSAFLPVAAGVLARPFLGVDAAAFDETGSPVVGDVGDFVIRQPMPSMPTGFWDDPDGTRFREAYFQDFPGVWRHGDWIQFEEDRSSVIYGRSDATLNRGGVRMGSAEFYRVLDGIEQLEDSLVIDTSSEGASGQLIVFVVPSEGADQSSLADVVSTRLRQRLSPRHRPDHVVPVPAIPRTLSGKRMEIPVKQILQGGSVEDVVEPSSVGNPQALRFFETFRLPA